jgi:IS30 family transposase
MYKQLSREQRYAIYLGIQEKKSYTAIARQIGCSISTVSREVKRNSNRHGRYIFRVAVELTQIRRERSLANRRTPLHVLKQAVNLLLTEDWSPKQISGYLKKQGVFISHERIYREIRNDETGEYRKHCRHKLKYRHHGHLKRKTAGKTLIPNRVSIHDRPVEADGKRFGDWEMDLVLGKGQKSAVLTIIERSTNMFFQSKLESKKPKVVAAAAYRLLLPYKAFIKTITTDNGSEFMEHQWLAKKLNTTVYFADPFCSGQKGAVENANKLLRQYFPKGTDFREVSQSKLNEVQVKINRRPREKLNFSTPVAEFFKTIV